MIGVGITRSQTLRRTRMVLPRVLPSFTLMQAQ
jgi:hypothetical protein